jgi:arsenate reductase
MRNVLILCTGNSCRSILGEALFKHLGAGRVQVFSAGSRPTGRVNPNALATLQRHGLPTDGYASKSWDDLEGTPMDIVITVCDSAAGEACPAYLGQAIRGHWGLLDPAHATGTAEEIAAAFEATYAALEKRVEAFLSLPLEDMTDAELAEALRRVHAEVAP